MNKTIYNTGKLAVLAVALTMTACSDDFLEEKRLFGKYNEATVYETFETAESRIDYLYWQMQPGQLEGDGMYMPIINTGGPGSAGSSNDEMQATEEYAGISLWEDNRTEVTYRTLNSIKWDHFYVEFKENSPYGNIRNINDAIQGLEGSTGLTAEQKNQLLGQAYFMRAWRYYTMVRWYGGVPIITEVQNALSGSSGGLDLVVHRPTTKQCIDFICEDLDRAASMLPAEWERASANWGRVTAGTALALKGRVLLLWASPLFNRADEADRWEAAYEANKAALEKLAEGNFGLAYENNPGAATESAANWGKIFLNTQGTDGQVNEAVFVSLYNKLSKQSDNTQRWNGWEQSLRPKTASGGGGLTATAEIVDLFPMADGKKPGESVIPYDRNTFFAQRDPRFYRTFAFPGVKWTYDGNTRDLLTDDKTTIWQYPNIQLKDGFPYNGSDFVLWSYAWYDDETKKLDDTRSGWYADALADNRRSVYVRKRSDDRELNGEVMYVYTDNNGNCSFSQSGAPYMEMRYAEVLLNFAEAAAATNRGQESLDALKRIRSRVYTADAAGADYGLTNGTRAQNIAQVLYERQIELAYEGKRYEDMRRWLLFDGGTRFSEISGAPATWTLSGFGGNTCTFLGVEPANQHGKNHIIEVYCNTLATSAESNGADPILTAGIQRPELNLMDRAAGEQTLVDFYTANFSRKDRPEDNTAAIVPEYKPYYYIPGFDTSGMTRNPILIQTIGWEDYSHGGMGQYDPLETDPSKLVTDNRYN